MFLASMEVPLVRRMIPLSKGNALFKHQDVRLENGQSGAQLLVLELYTLDIYPLYRTFLFLLLVCGETVSTNTV